MMHQWIALYISFLSIYGSAMETSPEKILVHNIPTIRYDTCKSIRALGWIISPHITKLYIHIVSFISNTDNTVCAAFYLSSRLETQSTKLLWSVSKATMVNPKVQ